MATLQPLIIPTSTSSICRILTTVSIDLKVGTHAKLEVFMVEEGDPVSVYTELANPSLLKRAVFIIMLDFTAPWNFIQEYEKWVKFIN